MHFSNPHCFHWSFAFSNARIFKKAHWAGKIFPSPFQFNTIVVSLVTENRECQMGKILSFNKSFFNDHFPRNATRAMLLIDSRNFEVVWHNFRKLVNFKNYVRNVKNLKIFQSQKFEKRYIFFLKFHKNVPLLKNIPSAQQTIIAFIFIFLDATSSNSKMAFDQE